MFHSATVRHVDIKLDNLDRVQTYHLMTQAIVPRPIAWVLSDNGPGATGLDRWNLAPFSYFNGVSSNPAQLMFSIGHGMDAREVKDTYVNLRARPQFVLHIPTVPEAANVVASARPLPHGEGEVSALDLDVAWPPEWSVPRLATSKLAMACTVDQMVDVVAGLQQIMVIAHVTDLWVDDDVTVQDAEGNARIDPVSLDPLARLGGGLYAAIGAPFKP